MKQRQKNNPTKKQTLIKSQSVYRREREIDRKDKMTDGLTERRFRETAILF